jgi:hypothetical protein
VLIVKIAVPLLSEALPRVVVPSTNVTDPLGIEVGVEAEEDTVAVRVTVCPLVAGFGDAASSVVVVAGPERWEPPEPFDEPPQPARNGSTERRQAAKAKRMGHTFKVL